MEQIERIEKMEAVLNEAKAAVEAFAAALERFSAAQSGIRELDAYLGSDEWLLDRDADEAGRLPEELRRGVLSEDGIYNVLMENRLNMKEALALAADYL